MGTTMAPVIMRAIAQIARVNVIVRPSAQFPDLVGDEIASADLLNPTS